MFYFLLILQVLLFFAFIVGLIKPGLVMGWRKNPSRSKVFINWITFSFIIGIGMGVSVAGEDYSEIDYSEAEEALAVHDYDKAIEELDAIAEDEEYFEKAQVLRKTVDSLIDVRRVEEEEASKGKLKSDLSRIVSEFKEGKIDLSKYSGSIEDLQMGILLFAGYGQKVTEAAQAEDPETKDLANQLMTLLSRVQKKEYPRMRKEYADLLSKKLWENDIKVHASGPANRYLNVTGGIFAANKNKQDFHTEMRDVLEEFRFTQNRFRWYDGEDEYTYWELEVPGDGDVVVLD